MMPVDKIFTGNYANHTGLIDFVFSMQKSSFGHKIFVQKPAQSHTGSCSSSQSPQAKLWEFICLV